MPEAVDADQAASHWSADNDALAQQAVTEVLARRPTMGSTRLLAIDGPAASGKSSLAVQIASLLTGRDSSVEVLSLDDLYDGWDGLDAALELRVREQVLEPLRLGRSARWQAYDWAAGCFGSWRDLHAVDVLVLEGCGAGARLFGSYTTLLVWVEAEAELRAQRAVVRDGAAVLAHWSDWAALEEETFARNAVESRADLRLRT